MGIGKPFLTFLCFLLMLYISLSHDVEERHQNVSEFIESYRTFSLFFKDQVIWPNLASILSSDGRSMSTFSPVYIVKLLYVFFSFIYVYIISIVLFVLSYSVTLLKRYFYPSRPMFLKHICHAHSLKKYVYLTIPLYLYLKEAWIERGKQTKQQMDTNEH